MPSEDTTSTARNGLITTEPTLPSRICLNRLTSGARAKDISTASAKGISTGRPK